VRRKEQEQEQEDDEADLGGKSPVLLAQTLLPSLPPSLPPYLAHVVSFRYHPNHLPFLVRHGQGANVVGGKPEGGSKGGRREGAREGGSKGGWKDLSSRGRCGNMEGAQ
jgi:hypothetical protein